MYFVNWWGVEAHMGQQSKEIIEMKNKRTWRIGTVSMGLSLVLLGVLIFMKQALGMKVIEPILIWWPIILMVLGIEIVAYLFISKPHNQTLKYDFMSIIFIAILGSFAVLFTLFNSFGLADEIETAMNLETITYELPEWEEAVPSHIEKVVIVTGRYDAEIDVTASDELHVLGTYRITSDDAGSHRMATVDTGSHRMATNDAGSHRLLKSKEDVGFTKVVDRTMYVYLKDLPRESGMFAQRSASAHATIVIPERLEVEVRRY